jgi:queuine tRNA-ribosyltransferase
MEGDFKDVFKDAPKPRLIFYDPFSTKTEAEMWDYRLFTTMASYIASDSLLLTYTSSTLVRASLLAAGWWVAPGVESLGRSSTTKAYLAEHRPDQPLLDEAWLRRWQRSDAAVPEALDESTTALFREKNLAAQAV